ncbi:zincin-like metallopeptidase domain-containing protein [Puniceibacterium sp. IMCC21224]|uniref:zincin-like metallopeptidase domain-containing protein n=1 Tax=Puniceibacterium sp. IMCC21224 TaxID=1618204 RepID=UPI00210138C3|nr:zincin-like metallopeptidase domain-containing protein [Puniceibacterium sp. IMCC21224]
MDRLGRFNDRKAYAFEELVAEIGNCMLCAQIGVEPEFDQSAPPQEFHHTCQTPSKRRR